MTIRVTTFRFLHTDENICKRIAIPWFYKTRYCLIELLWKNDYRQLEQQYHIRNGMDNLHASRINVLREKQGKQTERIMAKQEAELEALESDFEHQNDELDINFEEEEQNLQQEFAERKKRLIRRWDLAELIERRKLELEKGVQYGPLPAVKWSHDTNEARERRDERTRREIAPEVNMAYDAMNMI